MEINLKNLQRYFESNEELIVPGWGYVYGSPIHKKEDRPTFDMYVYPEDIKGLETDLELEDVLNRKAYSIVTTELLDFGWNTEVII